MSGDLLICIIFAAFLLIALKHLLPRKPKETVEDDDVEDAISLGDMSLTATRETFFVSEGKSSAVAMQSKPAADQAASPRGATRVKPKTPEIDYSIFDVPTYQRRAIQLSF